MKMKSRCCVADALRRAIVEETWDGAALADPEGRNGRHWLPQPARGVGPDGGAPADCSCVFSSTAATKLDPLHLGHHFGTSRCSSLLVA